MTPLDRLLAEFNPDLPLSHARTIPASWYLDPQLAEAERRCVFGQSWQAVGRRAEVSEPGSYLTAEIAGEPIAVVRDQSGELRAFFNVCRHRAARVLTESCGRTDRLRCRYHGWTYDLTGRLRGVPEFDGVADFSRDDYGLVPITVAEWGPSVWVRISDGPSLGEWLAPLPSRLLPGTDNLHFYRRVSYDLACNWKVYVDNYLDGGYHVNTIHTGLAGVLDYKNYRTELFERVSLQSSPLVGSGDSVSQVRQGSEAQYWWIYPNFMINVYSGVMDTNLVLPLAVDRCRVVFDFYFADTNPEFAEQSIAIGHQIQLEDQDICEDVQRGLQSRSYSTGRFSVRREGGGYHFHRLLARQLRAG